MQLCRTGKKSDLTSDAISTEEIVARLGFPAHPKLVEAAGCWISQLPLANPLDILDFLYIEQRLECWAGPNHYGHTNNIRIVPLSDREIFSLMLQLPADYRFRQQLATDLIKQLWPELLSIPFNKDTRIREAAKWVKNKSRAFVQSKPALKNKISALRRFFR
ncbi:MAG: hypothetical protein QNJ41_08330 [Xenococcaceae cyanobacterium MO_188.B32]|nr:hypothetical protein [Xenococcaceae cyanobacterium MO_188.B32]